VRQCELRHQECAFEVDVNLKVPFFLGAIEGGVRIEEAGVVEENIEPAERAGCLLDGAMALVGLANIGADKDSLATFFEYLPGYGVTTFLVATGDGYTRTLGGEQVCGGLADSRGATGNESDFVVQLCHLPHTIVSPLEQGLSAACQAAAIHHQGCPGNK